MSTQELPARELQALEQVGVTSVSRVTAWVATILFLITVFSVPVGEPIADHLERAQLDSDAAAPSNTASMFGDFVSEIGTALSQLGHQGVLATNRALLSAINEFEERLERESLLRDWLLPRMQWRLAAAVGLGNEQVYVGRDGWLFFRPDLDHVLGPGFLDPQVMIRRRHGVEVWSQTPEPDPLVALVDFHQQLAERGIHLIVVPTPVKPTVEPQRFSSRAESIDVPLQNSSFGPFLERLGMAGIEVLDPAPLLVQRKLETGDDRYLRLDTHWTPTGVDETARALARKIESSVPLLESDPGLYRRREVAVEGMGDIAQMLALPAGQRWIRSQRVAVQLVSDRNGKRWRSLQDSEILLLGDSFSNVYSDPTLGWGAGAGLGEQLSYHLQRPLDKLTVNAGGALQARKHLQRALSAGEGRLAQKRVVVYQFATRELSHGDWRVLEFHE